MRTLIATLALCGTMWFATGLQAADRGPFQLLSMAQIGQGSSVPVTPVRIGVGWRGYGYYPGVVRPYATYGGYYGNYYRPYGYYGGYGTYYRPYGGYYGYRPYGGYYRW